MTNIIKPDQHLASYVYQKQTDPATKIMLRAYKRRLVEKIDAIVELAHGQRDLVRTESDWVVVEALLKFFANEWPYEYSEFKSSLSDVKQSRRDGGYSESREIKYIGAIPPRFMKMVKAIFPGQQWDKKFMSKFVRRFPLFKVG